MTNIDIFKQQIQEMMNTDYPSFVEAFVSIETGETNKEVLETLYHRYMDRDDVTLLNEFFSKQYGIEINLIYKTNHKLYLKYYFEYSFYLTNVLLY